MISCMTAVASTLVTVGFSMSMVNRLSAACVTIVSPATSLAPVTTTSMLGMSN